MLKDIRVYSRAIDGNLLGDPPERDVTVYLPPGYGDDPGRRYPVIYLLHGYDADFTLWTAGSLWLGKGWNIRDTADSLIRAELIQPMIIVMPDANNRYDGSWYVNSPVTGGWDDFITTELTGYIDRNYRTLPAAESRGIAGHSMGGFGAVYLGMSHPDSFGALYGLSPGGLDFDVLFFRRLESQMLIADSLQSMEDYDERNFWIRIAISAGAAFAPNPENPPFFADFPFIKSGEEAIIDTGIRERWLAFDPLNLATGYARDSHEGQKIRFDCGTEDFLIASNRTFSAKLTELGIEHAFAEYEGNHLNRISERIENEVLPFFSESLEHEIEGIQSPRLGIYILLAILLSPAFIYAFRLFRSEYRSRLD